MGVIQTFVDGDGTVTFAGNSDREILDWLLATVSAGGDITTDIRTLRVWLELDGPGDSMSEIVAAAEGGNALCKKILRILDHFETIDLNHPAIAGVLTALAADDAVPSFTGDDIPNVQALGKQDIQRWQTEGSGITSRPDINDVAGERE